MYSSLIGLILVSATVALGDAPLIAKDDLAKVAAANGSTYIAGRDQLVNRGSNSVAQLQEWAANTNEPWKVRLMAGIVAERIQHGPELVEIIGRDWTKDPEYKREWEKARPGPVVKFAPLVTRRFREQGLYWYYTELSWKETNEHSMKPLMDETTWRGCGCLASTNAPVFPLLVEVLAERIRNDIGFKKYERWGEYEFLLESTTNTPLPHLLDIIPNAPLNNRNSAYRRLAKQAQPEDVPMIEKHFKDKGQEVPEAMRESLNDLKEQLRKRTETQRSTSL